MRIHNELGRFLKCVESWPERPESHLVEEAYGKPLAKLLAPMFEDFSGYRGQTYQISNPIADIENWSEYRNKILTMNVAQVEKRFRLTLQKVEDFFGKELSGDVLLWGSFHSMDGYARFHEGKHFVYLGLDEIFSEPEYAMEVLMAHELTHVVREGTHKVWQEYGLNPLMTHDEFRDSQPTLEHLFGEGFSCAVSKFLNPEAPDHRIVYQSVDSMKTVYKAAQFIDQGIHQTIEDANARYWVLYNSDTYPKSKEYPEVPRFSHYAWAWKWIESLCRAEKPQVLAQQSSAHFRDSALKFSLRDYVSQ